LPVAARSGRWRCNRPRTADLFVEQLNVIGRTIIVEPRVASLAICSYEREDDVVELLRIDPMEQHYRFNTKELC
jgi:hypothetical protein